LGDANKFLKKIVVFEAGIKGSLKLQAENVNNYPYFIKKQA
jgi:hypothetical protein